MNKTHMKLLLAVLISAFLGSCAGYQLGGAKPPSLANVKTIAVPVLENQTFHPRAEALATSAVTGALVSGGTYRLETVANADAILQAKIVSVSYFKLRSSTVDTRSADELIDSVRIDWSLIDGKVPGRVLAVGQSTGRSHFFAEANLQTSRQNALSDAFERAAQNLVSKLSHGY